MGYWLVSLFTVQVWMMGSTLPKQMGSFYVENDRLFNALLQHSMSTLHFEDSKVRVLVSRPRARLQRVLAILFKGIGFLYIGNTVPLLLSQSSSPLEYVMNCFA